MKNVYVRLLAILTVLCLVLGGLCACVTPDVGDKNPPVELQSEAYKATVEIRFATNDDKMKAAIDSMNASATILTDGESLSVSTLSTTENSETKKEYVLAGGTLYHSTSVKVGALSVSEQKKAAFSSENKNSLISKAGPGAAIGIEDFYVVDTTMAGDVMSYTCSDVFEDTRSSLASLLGAQFDALGASLQLGDVEYICETRGGRTESSILTVNCTVTMDGESYEITMRTYVSYDYDAEIQISSPENAADYREVSYGEILE